MSIRKKVKSALTAVFPTTESIDSFIEDSEKRQRLQSFIELAVRHGLIASTDQNDFKAFISKNHRPSTLGVLDGMSMEELVNNKKEYLNIGISNRALTERINLLLSKNRVRLPRLSNAMFSRLKKQAADTPRKRDALRSLAFWIGYERCDMGQEWHFESLKHLCRDDVKKTINNPFGVRVAFSINGRGNVVGQDIMLWLKRTLKIILSERTDTFVDGMPISVKNYDIVTLYIDLTNRNPGTIPAAFGESLKAAVSIAHRLSICWMISGYADYSRFCFVGIGAGEFSGINSRLQAVLTARIPGDPVIRLTDFARQCVMINDIKVFLNHTPKEVELINSEAVKVWWVTEFPSMLYWELTPHLLGGSFSGDSSSTYLKLKRQLMFQSDSTTSPQNDNAISYYLNFPHYSMLGHEIVRALFCRKRLMEALEILNVLLKINPDHVSSRVMRMMIYRIFGVEALNYRLADMMFRRAEKEAQYISVNFNHKEEDYYYEYAVLKLARLAAGVRALRKHPDGIVSKGLQIEASDLLALADDAEEILMQGISVSLSVERIYYLFYSVHILKIVLAENISDNGFSLPRLTCPKKKIKQYLLEVLISSSKYQKFSTGVPDIAAFNQIITDMMRQYESKIAVDTFKPTLYFANAIIFWDLMPVRSVAFVLSTLKELKRGISAAKTHALKNELIFSCVTMSGQIVTAEEYIEQVSTIVEEIEKRYGMESELKKFDPAQEMGSDDDDLVLMTYHV